MCPQLLLVAEIFLYTATVEYDFRTTNRILTDLRNHLTIEHLEQLMRILVEGSSDLNNDLKDLIIDYEK
ncbi:unnamed protein product, partial [Rotaria sordida]